MENKRVKSVTNQHQLVKHELMYVANILQNHIPCTRVNAGIDFQRTLLNAHTPCIYECLFTNNKINVNDESGRYWNQYKRLLLLPVTDQIKTT